MYAFLFNLCKYLYIYILTTSFLALSILHTVNTLIISTIETFVSFVCDFVHSTALQPRRSSTNNNQNQPFLENHSHMHACASCVHAWARACSSSMFLKIDIKRLLLVESPVIARLSQQSESHTEIITLYVNASQPYIGACYVTIRI